MAKVSQSADRALGVVAYSLVAADLSKHFQKEAPGMPSFYEHWRSQLSAADTALLRTFEQRVRTARKDLIKGLQSELDGQ